MYVLARHLDAGSRFRRDLRRLRWRLIPLVAALMSLFMVSGGLPDPFSGRPDSPAEDLETAVATSPMDDFYVPPEPLPDGEPGTVIRSRPVDVGPPSFRGRTDAWQVMYRSTGADGEPNAVTGTVIVPSDLDNPGDAPIIGFGPGTQGPAAECAPSFLLASGGSYYEQAALDDMIDRGYAVAVPDYEGYHPDPATTYILSRSTGPALVDSVRAAQQLDEAGLAGDAPIVFRGYSQGGGAAMAAGETHPDYAPELNLVGVAAGGVPGDLAGVGLPLDGAAAFGVVLNFFIGVDNARDDFALADYFHEDGMAEIAHLQEEGCIIELLFDYQGNAVDDFTPEGGDNPMFDPAVLATVNDNRLGSRAIEVPVYQYHDVGDEFVAFGQADQLHQRYCDNGTQLTWETYDDGRGPGWLRHLQLISGANPAVNQFIEERLAGEPGSSTC